MDKYNNNKATPKKRTGIKNDNDLKDAITESDKDPTPTILPEIVQPNPSSATPTIPVEMPARETK